MRHHRGRHVLSEAVEGCRLGVRGPLGQHEADELVVALHVRLLAGGVGLAVEYGGEPAAVVELDGRGVRELASVVRYQKFLISVIIRNLALSGISDAA